MTLEPDTEVLYKVCSSYAASHDSGLVWNDPSIGIAWPHLKTAPILSDKDGKLRSLTDFNSPFEYYR